VLKSSCICQFVASDRPCPLKLEAWGIQVTRGVARTGVVGTLEGSIPGECSVGLRAGRPASWLGICARAGLPCDSGCMLQKCPLDATCYTAQQLRPTGSAGSRSWRIWRFRMWPQHWISVVGRPSSDVLCGSGKLRVQAGSSGTVSSGPWGSPRPGHSRIACGQVASFRKLLGASRSASFWDDQAVRVWRSGNSACPWHPLASPQSSVHWQLRQQARHHWMLTPHGNSQRSVAFVSCYMVDCWQCCLATIWLECRVVRISTR